MSVAKQIGTEQCTDTSLNRTKSYHLCMGVKPATFWGGRGLSTLFGFSLYLWTIRIQGLSLAKPSSNGGRGEGSSLIYSQPSIDKRWIPSEVQKSWEDQEMTLIDWKLMFRAVENADDAGATVEEIKLAARLSSTWSTAPLEPLSLV